MRKKFEKIFERVMGRLEMQGFLVGDYVKFKKGFQKTPEYALLGDNVKELIQKFQSEDLNIRITGLNTLQPHVKVGTNDPLTGVLVATIAQDQLGGRIYTGEQINVPVSLLDTAEIVNHPEIPKSKEYKSKAGEKYEEVKGVEAMTTHPKEGARELPKSNTKLKHSDSFKGTEQYLKGF